MKSIVINYIKQVITALILLVTFSCDNNEPVENFSSIIIPKEIKDTIVFVQSKGVMVTVYLSFPANCNLVNKPAVVVLHGFGGMWKDNDPDQGIMSRQNREWREILDQECIVGAYVDSYSPRGCVEREGKWETPPEAFDISSQFVRPYDAYAALNLLKNLVDEAGQSIVHADQVGILGFSDGATAVAATLFDANFTPSVWEWTQKYDGEEFTKPDGVEAPYVREAGESFACGIFYYGGSVGNSYWGGNPCSSPDYIYSNYAPLLYHLPENGYLTENTLCSYDKLKNRGAQVEKYIYENATHGFDGDKGDEKEHSDLARARTIEWLRSHF